MINCIYLNYNEVVLFGTIVEEKNDPGKTTLRNISARVCGAYNDYLNDFDRLQKRSRSVIKPIEIDEKNALHLCYSSVTQTFRYVRGKIFEIQPEQLKTFCPYCLLNSPDTLDHYIGQTEFPEYSIISRNLIPCCYTCNQLKGEAWRKGGLRRIIHFYNDSFFNNNFLNAKLLYRRGSPIPKISFFLKRPIGMAASDFRIVKLHFKDLGLLAKYNARANTLVSSEFTVLSNARQKGRSLTSLVSELKDRSTTESLKSGVNYWVAVMYETLANDSRFLDSL